MEKTTKDTELEKLQKRVEKLVVTTQHPHSIR